MSGAPESVQIHGPRQPSESSSHFDQQPSSNRPLIVCDSIHHGNTRQIAQVLADVIGGQVVTPDEISWQSSETRIVGMGSGIYFGAHSRKIRQLAGRLPPGQRRMFIFSTAGLPMFWKIFHWPLRRILRSKGIEIAGEFHCPGRDTFGLLVLTGGIWRRRPNAQDLDRARAFAERLVETLRESVTNTSEEC